MDIDITDETLDSLKDMVIRNEVTRHGWRIFGDQVAIDRETLRQMVNEIQRRRRWDNFKETILKIKKD